VALFRSKQARGEPVMVAETFEAQLIEAQARNREAAELVDAALAAHANPAAMVDLLLDIRSALAPSPVGSQVPLVRRSVPMLPRRQP
jgi:hypothetical protein